MIGDALALIEFLRKHSEALRVLSALIDWQGNVVDGDEKIGVEIIPIEDGKRVWYYRITGPEGYVFVHMPVIAGLHLDCARMHDRVTTDANYFRYVSTPLSGSIKGGAPNTEVDFLVYGYRPKDLLATRK